MFHATQQNLGTMNSKVHDVFPYPVLEPNTKID